MGSFSGGGGGLLLRGVLFCRAAERDAKVKPAATKRFESNSNGPASKVAALSNGSSANTGDGFTNASTGPLTSGGTAPRRTDAATPVRDGKRALTNGLNSASPSSGPTNGPSPSATGPLLNNSGVGASNRMMPPAVKATRLSLLDDDDDDVRPQGGKSFLKKEVKEVSRVTGYTTLNSRF